MWTIVRPVPASDSHEIHTLAVVLGRNCKRIREAAGLTQNTLARYARESGLRWTAAKVGQFERGAHSPTFATVLAATRALTLATGWPVALGDLVESDDFVAINDDLFAVSGEQLKLIVSEAISWRDLKAEDVCAGAVNASDAEAIRRAGDEFKRLHYKYELGDAPLEFLLEISRKAGTDEDRLAKRLQISDTELAAASWRAWGRTFSDERDDRAGPESNAQKRGQVSRALQVELERFVNGDN